MVSSKRNSTNSNPNASVNNTSTAHISSNEASTGANLTRATSSSSTASVTNKAVTTTEKMAKHVVDDCTVCSKFKEGERVLCFEPDPTKVRVVYDAKILRISVTVDEKQRGKNNHEFLVHFQGWNASWDRFVPLSYLLKVFFFIL